MTVNLIYANIRLLKFQYDCWNKGLVVVHMEKGNENKT